MTSGPRYAAALTVAALLAGALVGSASPAAADDPPTLSISDTTIADPTEGNSGSKSFTFDVTLTGTVTQDVVVSARTFAGSASFISDFTDTLQELTFTAPGTKVVAVPVHGDHVQEADEDFIVRISTSTPGVVIADNTGVAIIVNDDGPKVRIDGPSGPVTESKPGANPGVARFTITATHRGASTKFLEAVVVNYETVPVDGGAEPGKDYEPVEGTATLAPPSAGITTTLDIEVPILGDAVYEGADPEEFTVVLSDLANGVWELDGGGQPRDVATGRIKERDDPPALSILDADVIEGDAGETATALVTVALSQLSTQPVSFTHSTRDGTGANAAKVSQDDYTPIAPDTPGAVPPLSRTTTIEVEVIGDDGHEDNEVFHVDLALAAGETGATLAPDDAAAAITIRNDEGAVITVDDVTAPEDAAGTTTPFEFTVSLSEPVATDVEVGYATADVSASATIDYVPIADAAVTIPKGATSATVTVDVLGDDFPGYHEDFHLVLTGTTPGFSGPTIMRARGVGTLLNDDGGDLTVDDVTVKRNKAGVLKAKFQVKLSEPSTCDDKFHEEHGCDVLVGYRTVNGSAKAGTHYTHTEGTLRIPRGATTGTVTVDVAGGTDPAPTRKFTLELDPAAFARTVDASVTATILNDVGPTLTIGDVTVARPPSGRTDARFPVTLSKATTDTVKVRFGTVDGTATTAAKDYVERSGTLTIPAGQTAGTIVVEVVGDPDKTGADQTFEVVLSDPAFARLGTDVVGKATIDNPPDPAGGGGGGGGGAPPPVGEVVRTSGDTRITTAVAVSREHWATATDAVLATAWNYPDALAAGALAKKLGAPLLLTDREALPDEVAAELARLGATRVWVMGGTAAVSQAVEDALVDAGLEVRRSAGDDRFETAALVADEVGASPEGEVLIALGIHEIEDRAWPDALAAGALAASPDGLPTLLTHGASLTRATADALEALEATRVYLLGGTAAISPNVAAQLETLGYEVVRLAGDDRWGTSAAVATEALSRHAGDRVPVVFATGRNFPDGLAAGALAARLGALVVLVPPDDLEGAGAVRDLLSTNRARLGGGVVVGGPAAVTDAVLSQLRDALTSG